MSKVFAVMAAFYLMAGVVIVAPHVSWPVAQKIALFCFAVGAACAFLAVVIKL